MKSVHYFQRYSQKENWITNSTLLLMSRLYNSNIHRFKEFISSLLSKQNIEVDFGISFGQQVRAASSVPDGKIFQTGIELIVESKLHDNYDIKQLTNHLDSFSANSEFKVLIGLSVNDADRTVYDKVQNKIKSSPKYSGIKFVAVTFKEVYESFLRILKESDYELREIAEDYYSLCFDEGLVDLSDSYMLAFTAGTSVDENLKYDVYYDPSDRNNNIKFRYLSLYENKTIVAIGKLTKIAAVDLVNGVLVPKNTEGSTLTQVESQRIKDIISSTNYYDIETDHKFYLVEKFIPTDFRKVSSGPMRAKKYFYLPDFISIDSTDDATSIASKLNQVEWE